MVGNYFFSRSDWIQTANFLRIISLKDNGSRFVRPFLAHTCNHDFQFDQPTISMVNEILRV